MIHLFGVCASTKLPCHTIDLLRPQVLDNASGGALADDLETATPELFAVQTVQGFYFGREDDNQDEID